MFRTLTAALLAILSVASVPAFAAEGQSATPAATSQAVVAPAITLPASLLGNVNYPQPPAHVEGGTRGSVLPALYVSLAALQAFDAYSTTTALNQGAREANPVMGKVAGNSAALWAVKGGATVASIYTAERLWKQGRRGPAIAVMLVSNGIMVAVAAHNASVLNAQR